MNVRDDAADEARDEARALTSESPNSSTNETPGESPTEVPMNQAGTGPRILIVDDQRSNIRLLEHTLRRAGYAEVMSTVEPREVVGLHSEHQYDLILLDLQMPEMSGIQVLEQLQATRAAHRLSVLVLSADPSQKAAARNAGADDFLSKPFRLPDVVDRIRLMLGPASTKPASG